MKTVWTDRSRVETFQRCGRLRFLEYHQDGQGIAPMRKPLPLAVGGSVHVGLAILLRASMTTMSAETVEHDAVAAALADFATHRSALALDTQEAAAMASTIDVKDAGFDAQLTATARDLGMAVDDPALAELLTRQRNSAAEFDSWLFAEQSALVEGMVRAYSRRRLRPLLEEFEVLEVEREGDWLLSSWENESTRTRIEGTADWNMGDVYNLYFMSRPDALLRSRTDNSLYLLSYKTAASWDIRKARDAEHDMQGLSEGVEVERRLGEWWAQYQSDDMPPEIEATAMYKYLSALPAPPRILGIRYEYLLKGSRWEDKDLSARFGLKVWAQRSHLVRAYHSDAGQWCWSYDFLKDDGSASKLYYKTWRPRAVWESMSIKEWIDLLDSAEPTMSAEDSTVGLEPRLLGWRSAAQAQGYTAEHPLDAIFVPPITIYRSDDQLRDWIEQVEAQERRVAESVARVDAVADDGERRHLLNTLFVQSRRSCSYPVECAMTRICFGGDAIKAAPLESGLYRRRVPHHTPEQEALAGRAGGTL